MSIVVDDSIGIDEQNGDTRHETDNHEEVNVTSGTPMFTNKTRHLIESNEQEVRPLAALVLSERLQAMAGVVVASYTLLVIGVAASFIMAFITMDGSLVTKPPIFIYFTILCVTSSLCVLYLDIYLKRQQKDVNESRPNTPRAEGVLNPPNANVYVYPFNIMPLTEGQSNNSPMVEVLRWSFPTSVNDSRKTMERIDDVQISNTIGCNYESQFRSQPVIGAQNLDLAASINTLENDQISNDMAGHQNSTTPIENEAKQDNVANHVTDVKTEHVVGGGINSYFILGGLGFGVGSVILDMLMVISVMPGPECVDKKLAYGITLVIAHLLLTVFEMVFVIRRHNAAVHQVNLKCRLAIMHIVATNISLWLLLCLSDALESFVHHSEKVHRNITAPHYNSGTCDTAENLRDSASAYLHPCLIEFSLFMIPILHSIFAHNATDGGHSPKDHSTTKVNLHTIWRVMKRLHVGLIIIVLTILSQIAFFYVVSGFRNKVVIFLSTQILLIVTTIVAISVAFYKFGKLDFKGTVPIAFDEYLLFITMGGYILFKVSCGISSVYGLCTGRTVSVLVTVLMLLDSIVSMMHGMLQTIFVTLANRTCVKNEDQKKNKPGKSAIGFLIVSNLGMWCTLSFQTRELFAEDYNLFFDPLSWHIITFICIPIEIFYMFHSTVCLSDIWKKTYELKKQQ